MDKVNNYYKTLKHKVKTSDIDIISPAMSFFSHSKFCSDWILRYKHRITKCRKNFRFLAIFFWRIGENNGEGGGVLCNVMFLCVSEYLPMMVDIEGAKTNV